MRKKYSKFLIVIIIAAVAFGSSYAIYKTYKSNKEVPKRAKFVIRDRIFKYPLVYLKYNNFQEKLIYFWLV